MRCSRTETPEKRGAEGAGAMKRRSNRDVRMEAARWKGNKWDFGWMMRGGSVREKQWREGRDADRTLITTRRWNESSAEGSQIGDLWEDTGGWNWRTMAKKTKRMNESYEEVGRDMGGEEIETRLIGIWTDNKWQPVTNGDIRFLEIVHFQ